APAHDTDPPPDAGSAENPGENASVSCVSCVMHDPRPSGNGVGPAGGDTELESGAGAIVSCAPSYLLVRDRAGLEAVRIALDNTALVGLDLETTGLAARTDRARLLSLAVDTIDGGTFAYLVDCFAVDPAPLWDALGEKELVLHHAAFDLGFLSR